MTAVSRDYPARCAKCGRLCASVAALDQHFEDVQHPLDPDFPLYIARQRLERAREVAEVAALALAEAGSELARIEHAFAVASADAVPALYRYAVAFPGRTEYVTAASDETACNVAHAAHGEWPWAVERVS